MILGLFVKSIYKKYKNNQHIQNVNLLPGLIIPAESLVLNFQDSQHTLEEEEWVQTGTCVVSCLRLRCTCCRCVVGDTTHRARCNGVTQTPVWWVVCGLRCTCCRCVVGDTTYRARCNGCRQKHVWWVVCVWEARVIGVWLVTLHTALCVMGHTDKDTCVVSCLWFEMHVLSVCGWWHYNHARCKYQTVYYHWQNLTSTDVRFWRLK